MNEGRIIRMPMCTSCNRIIPPSAKATKFQCPDCGELTIWRCSKCREFRRSFKCPNCGFTGP